MSTEQTGVNAPTSEEPTQDEHAPRGSRRAIRQAERAAEREAILTGQQPLLTRREMRRLREEAKALRAAVEAGEITPEQAQALQDPLADPSSVTSRSSATSGDEAESAPVEPAEPTALDGGDYLEQGGQNPPLSMSVPEGPAASAPSWRSLSAAEAVAISEIETGLMEAVDLPVATLDYDAHWAANASSEPAPVPTRFSLKDRLEGGSVSEADEPESPQDNESQSAVEVSGDAETEEPATSPYDYREGLEPLAQDDGGASSQSSSAVEAVSAASAVPAVSATAPGAADVAAYGQAGATRSAEPSRSGVSAGSASSAGSVRRPIVRIPAAAQGVRTVNASTGELSSVQPVDSSPSAQEAADVQDVYGAPPIEEPMVQDDAEVEVDIEAQTMVVSTSAPSTQGAQDSEFGAPGAPQWRSLHQPPQAGSFQEAIVDGTAETAAVSGEAVSPYAFYSDEVENGNGPMGASEWDSVAAPAAEVPEEPYLAPVNEVTGRVPTPDHVLPMEQPGASSRTGKILMAALIIVLLLIIIAVVLALLISNGKLGGGTSAMAASVGAGEWIRQLV